MFKTVVSIACSLAFIASVGFMFLSSRHTQVAEHSQRNAFLTAYTDVLISDARRNECRSHLGNQAFNWTLIGEECVAAGFVTRDEIWKGKR